MENTILKEKVKLRIEQAEEMEDIWDEIDKETQMYLKGCIVTTIALAGKKEMNLWQKSCVAAGREKEDELMDEKIRKGYGTAKQKDG